MPSHSNSNRFDLFLRLLVTYRLSIYFGGLFIISAPLFLSKGIEIRLPSTVRTAIVGTALIVMIATYLAERRIGYGQIESPSNEYDEEYSLRLRLIVALSIIGFFIGIYICLEMSPLAGVLFIIGAYLFGYLGYNEEVPANNNSENLEP